MITRKSIPHEVIYCFSGINGNMIISKLELRNLTMNYKFSEREVEIKNSNAVKTSKKNRILTI